METKVFPISAISAMRSSSTVRMVPRKPMVTEPFSPQQRELIVVRFLKLHHTVTQIARSLGVGDIAVERVIRFEYWRQNGSRKADRIARAA